jgi:hypothetical protein
MKELHVFRENAKEVFMCIIFANDCSSVPEMRVLDDILSRLGLLFKSYNYDCLNCSDYNIRLDNLNFIQFNKFANALEENGLITMKELMTWIKLVEEETNYKTIIEDGKKQIGVIATDETAANRQIEKHQKSLVDLKNKKCDMKKGVDAAETILKDVQDKITELKNRFKRT